MKEQRPILDLPKTQLENILDGLALAELVIGLGMLLFYYGDLPQRIPIHYDGSGQPDGYGSKATLLILMVIAAAMAAGMWYLTGIPHKYNYPGRITPENAESMYAKGRLLIRILNASIVWIFTFIIWRTIEIANGQAHGLGAWFLPAVLITTIGIPVYMTFQMAGRAK